MEQLQANIARFLIRFGVLLSKATNRAIHYLNQFLIWGHRQTQRIPLTAVQWVLLAFAIFGLIYMVSTPIFEAGDELEHYTLVHVVKESGLPVQNVENPFAWHEQGNQPLLYYVLGAIVTKPIDTSDYLTYIQLNPHARPNDPFGLGNKNILLRDTLTSDLKGTALAVYVLRGLNLVFATIALWFIHRIGLQIAPKRPAVALLAIAITAFNPMFVFVMASVTNTSLALLLNTLVVFLTMQLLTSGLTVRQGAMIAVLLALGCATSLTTYLMIPVVLGVALYVAQRDRAWRNMGVLVALCVGFMGVTCGWWLYRNFQLYNDVSGLSIMTQLAGLRTESLTVNSLLGEFSYFRQSYWGLFGVGNIAIGAGFYLMIDLFVFLAIFGVVYLVMQLYAIRDFAHARRELVGVVSLLGFALVGMIAFFGWMIAVKNAQGRLLFAYIGAFSPLLATGFIEIVWWFLFFITPPDRSFVRAGDAVPNEVLNPNSTWLARFLAVLCVFIPLSTISAEYIVPTPIASLPESAQQIYARFETVELIGYETPMDRYIPGELVPVNLFWKVIEPTEHDLTVSIALLPPTNNEIGKLDTYPSMGKLRTSTWKKGAIYEDTYFIRIDSDILGNFPLRLQVTWWDDKAQKRIPIVDDTNRELEAVILDAGAIITTRALSSTYPSLSKVDPALREFGRIMRLEQFSFDRNTSRLLLIWDDLGLTDVDYTVFAQVIDKNNQVVGQFDARPNLPTSYWRYGERYYTDHPILYTKGLPVGDYGLIVGVYELNSMLRLPNGNKDNPQDYYRLFSFSVDEQGNISSAELDELQPEVTPEATDRPESTAEASANPSPIEALEMTPELAPTP